MIINEKITVTLGSKNYKYYISLGYLSETDYVNGKDLEIYSKDIKNTSKIKIRCRCNICNSIINKCAINHNFETDEDYCVKCKSIKAKNTIQYKIENNIYSENDKYMSTSYDKIYERIDSYIKCNGTIAGYTKDPILKSHIKNKKINLKSACEKLGYSWFDVGINRNSYMFSNKEELKQYIDKIIEIEGYFPTCSILNKYHIWNRTYSKFYDTYNDLKMDMGFKNQYIDKIGYLCKSNYELMFANYLIDHNYKFDRENKIVSNQNYRYDFKLYLNNDQFLYVEIWGLLKENPIGNIEIIYKQTHDMKVSIYNKNNMKLLSLVPEDFRTKNFMSSYLDSILSKYQIEEFIYDINTQYIENFYYNKIKQVINTYYKDLGYFPTIKQLNNDGFQDIVGIIYRHYGSIFDVSKLFDLPTKKQFKVIKK